MLNYYEILGVSRNASESEIKKSYRRLALRFHPDKNREDPPDEAAKKFREISEAYEILSNQRKRQQYDLQFQDSANQQFSIGDFIFRDPFDIFKEVFHTHRSFETDSLDVGQFFDPINADGVDVNILWPQDEVHDFQTFEYNVRNFHKLSLYLNHFHLF